MIKNTAVIVVILVFAGSVCPSYAVTDPWLLPPRIMEYKFSGEASGELGGLTFEDAAFEITSRAITSDIRRLSIGGRSFGIGVENLSASIEIEGIGSTSFTQETETWSNNRNIGFGRDFEAFAFNGGSDLISTFVESLVQPYNLYDQLDPFTVDFFNVVENQFVEISTSSGLLTLRDTVNTSGQFSAIPIPEPSTGVLLLAMGSTWFVGSRRYLSR